MTPLRVLYLIDSLGPGGAQKQLVTLVRSLDRALVAPEVAVYHPLFHFRPELDAAEVPVHLLQGSGGRDPRVLVALAGLLARERYDIVHSYLRTPGTLARLAALFSRVTRVVVSERNVDLGRSRGQLLLERILCNRADAMIVNAEATGREVRRLVPGWARRIHLVPNGLEWREPSDSDRESAQEFRKQNKGDADMLLGVVGRVERQKAPDLLVRALAQLPRHVISRIRVVWVGAVHDVDLATSAQAEADRMGLKGRFAFVGETADTRSVYLGVDGLLLASRWEGLPNAVLEAMAHSTPVVATDVGDTGVLLRGGECGWLVPAEDVRGFTAAIAGLVAAPPEVLQRMGQRGSQFVLENYSVRALVDRTMRVYERVLGQNSDASVQGGAR